MPGYDAVLFDLDGTLLDSARDFERILNRMCRQRQQPPVDARALRRCASEGARAMLLLAFADTEDDATLDLLQQEFLQQYADAPALESQLFDGVSAALDWLDQQRIPWGVVTNKPERFTRPILTQLQLLSRCGSVICPEQVQHPKPDPEALLLACRELASAPQRTLYLGDHRRDIEAGLRAGMCTLGCAYGYISASDDPRTWGAQHQVDDARHLHPLLQSLYSEPTL